ncbi:sulfurtransferase [Flavobacterium orientale]|uniref:Sulfurtransferase n=1 Tax=Flavobacterium orientale TaxID=1756020 RepID=A0A917DCL0_9FLAO|nr:sulfurtransferase [Flavobacterium orientale]GGD25370.1 sulfurtransferase [Flavobacterium orientale]
MLNKVTPLIQVYELKELGNSENLVILDVSNGKDAKSNYNKKHLDGAIFVDLNSQLTHIKMDVSIGGRHPLPSVEYFSKLLASLGITPEKHIVLYDGKNGSNAAARMWWMLKSIGHKKVQVLNGGLQEAERHNYPTNSKEEFSIPTKEYKIENWKLPLATIDEVEKASNNQDYLIIDVREATRYNGGFEPIDLISGHIPNAINIPFSTNLDENGLFLSPKLLKEKYSNVFENKNSNKIIVHCGSGVTACHTLLAMDYAGFEIPKLYVGSWSEWSRNNKSIATNQSI